VRRPDATTRHHRDVSVPGAVTPTRARARGAGPPRARRPSPSRPLWAEPMRRWGSEIIGRLRLRQRGPRCRRVSRRGDVVCAQRRRTTTEYNRHARPPEQQSSTHRPTTFLGALPPDPLRAGRQQYCLHRYSMVTRASRVHPLRDRAGYLWSYAGRGPVDDAAGIGVRGV